jgi:hypothetical protein
VDRFQNNGSIKQEGEMADVVEVIFEFADGVLNVGPKGVIDLGPSRNARFDQVAEMIALDFRFILIDQYIPFGPGSD